MIIILDNIIIDNDNDIIIENNMFDGMKFKFAVR